MTGHSGVSRTSDRMRRIVVGISGASGIIYGVRVLEQLSKFDDVESHAIITPGARRTAGYELDMDPHDLENLADVTHRINDLAAPISSGSFRTDGMIIAPCSIKTLSGVANCYADNLLIRAADVVLKERRPLVLMLRETPLHLGHIRLMAQAAEMGAMITPPVPAFYNKPQTIDDMVDYTVARALDQLGLEAPDPRRWGEPPLDLED